MNRNVILNQIKKYYGFKTDFAFAEYLGIKPNTLSNWHSRNSMDYDLIIEKCKEIDANWLFSGEGNMLKKEYENMHPSIVVPNSGANFKFEKKFHVRTGIEKDNNAAFIIKDMEIESLKKEILLLNTNNESLMRENATLRRMISLLEHNRNESQNEK